ncbi:unnamed protein product, partial [Gulo gulo]
MHRLCRLGTSQQQGDMRNIKRSQRDGMNNALQLGTTRSNVQLYLLAGTPNLSASPLARQ